MKILTKKWVEMCEQVRFVGRLKEYDTQKFTGEQIKIRSRNDFRKDVRKDVELAKVCRRKNISDNLYKSKIERDRGVLLSLPKDIYNKIKYIQSLVLGYACKEDKEILTSYADKIIKVIENQAEESNRLTEIAEDYLPKEFILDDFVGELVYKEYSIGKDYFITIGNRDICIENYEIIERERFKINEFEVDNPLTLWTALYAAELHYISKNSFELHLLLVDGDKYANEKHRYFTLKGTNVKIVRDYEKKHISKFSKKVV